jgi:hypothetical protein
MTRGGTTLVCALAFVVSACASLIGIDEDYVEGDVDGAASSGSSSSAASTSSSAGGASSTSSGTAGAPAGTGGAGGSGLKPKGESCTSDAECQSGKCAGNKCA